MLEFIGFITVIILFFRFIGFLGSSSSNEIHRSFDQTSDVPMRYASCCTEDPSSDVLREALTRLNTQYSISKKINNRINNYFYEKSIDFEEHKLFRKPVKTKMLKLFPIAEINDEYGSYKVSVPVNYIREDVGSDHFSIGSFYDSIDLARELAEYYKSIMYLLNYYPEKLTEILKETFSISGDLIIMRKMRRERYRENIEYFIYYTEEER